MEIAKEYKEFLDQGKTERECVTRAVEMAKERGYKNLTDFIENKTPIKAGDKIYATYMKKAIALFQIGTVPMEKGMNILGAHIDSPRLDLKQNPLYEEGGFAYFDTHYYGGIKKYQWVTLPLAIQGVVAKKDGEVVEISIGQKDEDPVFCITDLLIHLAGEQMEKKAAKVIEGEHLDVLIGLNALEDLGKEEKETVKKNVLNILKEQYGIEEKDFLSAELEVVPAGKSRDLGLDRSMVIGYGQDDRVCAFTSLVGFLETEKVEKTACCLLVDKEEIGSVGATGMQSKFFENFIAEILELMGGFSELTLRRTLANSNMLSSDVSAGFDPLYAGSFDKRNAAFLGKGLVFNKYTGSRGKSGSNDANGEYIAKLRKVLDEAEVKYQTAELGKVDAGGGGTIAYIMALYGMNVIDSGIAVLSMHSPWEVTSKKDLEEAVKGYQAFLSIND